jgi:pimeloyl-ACP methyl ester carboxylesterase
VNKAPTAYFLHGILGSKRNWRTPARACLKLFPEGYVGVAIDTRAHGDSIVSKDMQPHSVKACALDLAQFIEDSPMQPPSILVAHSFGGKVALNYLNKCLESDKPTPKHTWILDSIPGPYNKDYDQKQKQSVFGVLDELLKAPPVYSSRNEAILYLTTRDIPLGIAQWLATSLVQTSSGQWKYSFDISAISDLFDDFCKLNMWKFLETYNGQGNIHFVRAGNNNSWPFDLETRLLAISESNPRVTFQVMPNVGHWLHAENPAGLATIIASKL